MRRLNDGAELDELESEFVNDPPGLSDDDRAALWLFAWSYRHSPARRWLPEEKVIAR